MDILSFLSCKLCVNFILSSNSSNFIDDEFNSKSILVKSFNSQSISKIVAFWRIDFNVSFIELICFDKLSIEVVNLTSVISNSALESSKYFNFSFLLFSSISDFETPMVSKISTKG